MHFNWRVCFCATVINRFDLENLSGGGGRDERGRWQSRARPLHLQSVHQMCVGDGQTSRNRNRDFRRPGLFSSPPSTLVARLRVVGYTRPQSTEYSIYISSLKPTFRFRRYELREISAMGWSTLLLEICFGLTECSYQG